MADIAPHLQLRQTQRLVMTPQLQQALKILQLNSTELTAMVEQELADNPMLEDAAADSGDPAVPASPDPEPGSGADEPTAGEAALPERPSERTDELKLDKDSPGELADWADYFHDDGTDFNSGVKEEKEEKEGFAAFLTRPESLQEHLLHQLESDDLPDADTALVETVIGGINDRGYFEGEISALARELACDEKRVFEALRRVQRYDPPGVAARDLRECLMLQLEARGRRLSLAWDLVSDHLPELNTRRHETLAYALAVDLPALHQAVAEIEALEPIPGRPFGGELNAGVAVDAFVDKDPLTGRWVVQVNDAGLPRLGINGYYKRLMKQGEHAADAAEAKAWLKDKYQSALWLMRGIDQRHRTLRRVVEEIIKVQEGFLERGPSGFRPLTLKEIASATSLHESTISRVTTAKFIQTPRGVFELKFFFSSALKTAQGGEASSMAVKDRLRDLFEDEPAATPFSDQELVAQLEKEGVRIARRTVAKYREELGVPPAFARKKP